MEPFVPNLGYNYPEQPDAHMVEFKTIHDVKIDENYPFLEKTINFKFMRTLMHLGIYTIVFTMSPTRYKLKIEGREILRKHKKLFKNGAMTVSNHIHRWDFLFVMQAVRFRMMYFPVWKEQLNSKDKDFIRLAGGIPIPEEIKTIKCFNEAFDEIHKNKKWIHAFPESSRFDYFQPIRPFKKGVFTMAHRYKLPVIPMAFSYREPKGKNKIPGITLRVGEPILLDETLGRKDAVVKLRKECHEAIVRLAGIKQNRFPAEGD